jgi:hypothetical protein
MSVKWRENEEGEDASKEAPKKRECEDKRRERR